jgi:tetratricopeptide (TPR) repeat protein
MDELPLGGFTEGSEGTDSSTAVSSSAIALERWNPKSGYLDRLRRAPESERYSVYLEERQAHSHQPGFYLDCADFFLEAQDGEHGFRILSNLAEFALEDAALLRVLAQRLVQSGRPDLAKPLLEKVLAIRPDEPQSRRDLALVCAALKQFQRAVDLLWEVVERPWNARFPEIELIALGELNAIAATCGEPLELSRVDKRLSRNLPVGLRAVLTWDADSSDIDLWVVDPNGERCFYKAPLSYQGGRMSRDFTGGYGPEEFLLRDPKPGKYLIQINYYGDSRQTAIGPVTAQVLLITGFGTPTQEERRLTVRLEANKQILDIGSITIGGKQ